MKPPFAFGEFCLPSTSVYDPCLSFPPLLQLFVEGWLVVQSCPQAGLCLPSVLQHGPLSPPFLKTDIQVFRCSSLFRFCVDFLRQGHVIGGIMYFLQEVVFLCDVKVDFSIICPIYTLYRISHQLFARHSFSLPLGLGASDILLLSSSLHVLARRLCLQREPFSHQLFGYLEGPFIQERLDSLFLSLFLTTF